MLREALLKAEKQWRTITQRAYPLYGNKELVRVHEPKMQTPLAFYTDDERIYVELNDVKRAEKDFDTFVKPLFGPLTGQDGFQLWQDSLLFILFHELYHPLVCPDSVDDERELSCAIYRGLTKSESPAKAAKLSHNIKNLFWDLIVNVTYLARTIKGNHNSFQRASQQVLAKSAPTIIVPALYYQSACTASSDYLISTMGALYTELSVDDEKAKETLYKAFDEEGKRLGVTEAPSKLAKRMLAALLDKTLSKNRLVNIKKLLMTFEKSERRYLAIERAAALLTPFVKEDEPQGTLDRLTRGHRGPLSEDGANEGMADSWQDLAEGLSQEELDELQEALGKKSGALSGYGEDGGYIDFGKPAYIMAADSYYKKEALAIKLRQPQMDANVLDIGRQKRWKLKNVVTLSCADVVALDHNALMAFQAMTGLPVLLELSNGHYQLNEYELVRNPLKAYTLVDDLTIPDNWVLFVDSSGSMASADYVGSGSYYDLLMHICYGVAKGLWQACERLNRDLSFGVVNFSTKTLWSGMTSFQEAYHRVINKVKQTLLVPQSGGTSFDTNIMKTVEGALSPGTTVYTIITDGQIEEEAKVLQTLQNCAHREQTQLLFFEIGVKSKLGEELQRSSTENIVYFHVDKVEEIKDRLSDILLSYKDQT